MENLKFNLSLTIMNIDQRKITLKSNLLNKTLVYSFENGFMYIFCHLRLASKPISYRILMNFLVKLERNIPPPIQIGLTSIYNVS